MSELSLQSRLAGTEASPSWYRLAGHWIVTEDFHAELAPFAAAPALEVLPPANAPDTTPGSATLVYSGPGWLGGNWRTLDCWRDRTGYRLIIPDAGVFVVGGDGHRIETVQLQPGVDHHVVVETFLGPALVLALALQHTWCLHASAVMIGAAAVAFAGESGNGKSTLAAFLAHEDGATPWQYLADDVLPVELSDTGPFALPRFPQLKLAAQDQPAIAAPEQLPLRAIYVLSPSAGQHSAVKITPLDARAATLALVRHTVAARLFDRELLGAHLAFCAQASTQVPVRRLSYPHRHDALPQVRKLIASDLSALEA